MRVLFIYKKENNMPRTSYGLPGIYNTSPITLPDGAGSALAVDVNGKLLASQGAGTGSVSTANTPAISSSSTALAANPTRRGWQIQNVGINPLFVLLGTGATSSVFHTVLKGGSGASDGLGASTDQTVGVIYTGIITVAGTSPSYVVMEL